MTNLTLTPLQLKYRHGQCASLALAINRKMGLPCVIFYTDNEDKDAFHVANQLGDKFVDVCGIVTQKELEEYYHMPFTTEVDLDGSWTLSEFEVALAEFGETDGTEEAWESCKDIVIGAMAKINAELKKTVERQKNLENWFGNSKVVSKDGKPLTVYHGTGADIISFDNSKSHGFDKNKGGAMWFSTAPEVAGHFAGECCGEIIMGRDLGHSNILPVYLKIENPFVDHYGKYAYGGGITDEQIKEFKAEGYDGIHWPSSDADLPDTTMDGPVQGYYRNRFGEAWGESEGGYPDQWAAFDATQIKSAIGNSGKFDPTSADLTDQNSSPTYEVKNSKGKPLYPSKEGIEKFNDWFNGSEVTNHRGRPLVVYHATTRDVQSFDPEQSKDFGIHFGTQKAANKRLEITGRINEEGACIIPVYLQMKNPIVTPDYGDWHTYQILSRLRELGYIDETFEKKMLKIQSTDSDVRKLCVSLGIDGIIYKNDIEGGTSYIVFSPEQIKSALGNNGEFNKTSPYLTDTTPVLTPSPTPKELPKNSEGKSIHPTPEGIENFKKWFGEFDHPKAFSSKFPEDLKHTAHTVDEQNRPLVLYHVTHNDFEEFEVGRTTINSGTFGPWETKRSGIFATPHKEMAMEYVRNEPGAFVMPIYMNIHCPIDLRNNRAWDYVDELNEHGLGMTRWPNMSDTQMWEMFDDEVGEAFVAAAKSAGYDGVLMYEVDKNDEMKEVWVAFDPLQIKSAIGNSGKFDLKSPSLSDSPGIHPEQKILKNLLGMSDNEIQEIPITKKEKSDSTQKLVEYSL